VIRDAARLLSLCEGTFTTTDGGNWPCDLAANDTR